MFEKFYERVTDPQIFIKADRILQKGFDYGCDIINYYGDDYYEIEAEFPQGRGSVVANMIINPNELVRFFCQCRTHYNVNYCEHYLCLLAAVEDYAKTHPINRTSKVLRKLMEEHVPALNDEAVVFKQSVHIEPALELSGDKLVVSYKIGEGKNYVIKNITDFVDRMKAHENYSYGKNFTFNHYEEKLDDLSKENFALMKSYVDVVEGFMTNFMNNNGYYGYQSVSVKRYLPLSGQILDHFFEINKGRNLGGVYLSKDPVLDPISITTKEDYYSIQIPDYHLFSGDKYTYLLDNNTLYQLDASYQEINEMFDHLHGKELVVEKEDMKKLYSTLVPALKKKFEIRSNFDQSEFEPLEAKFVFYLDCGEDNDVTLVYDLKYGKKSYRINNTDDQEIRNLPLETKVGQFLTDYFIEDITTYHIIDDDTLFRFIDVGIDELNKYGEVLASEKFKRIQVFKSPSVDIGVKLESNLLNFDVDIEGVDISEINSILNSYRLKKKYHRLKSGEFLKIDEEKFKVIDEIAGKSKKDLKSLAEGNLNIPMYRSLYLDKLLEESDSVVYNPNLAFKQLIADFDDIKNKVEEVPATLNGTLRPYQKDGYNWLLKLAHYHFGGILADDMGLGKTIQVIAYLLKTQPLASVPSLIVTPASLVYNWESELNRFAPSLKVLVMTGSQKERLSKLESREEYDVLVTSYDLLKRDITYYEDCKFATEIIDEAQFIKNAGTLQAKAVKGVKAECKFALSGTPIENKLSELWSIFDYLMPGFMYSYNQFRSDYENPIVKDKNEAVLAKIQRMISPFILRRKKKDVLTDLPDKLEEVMYAKMESKQETLYTTYVKRIKMALSKQSPEEFKENKIQILQQLTRLRQLCCDPNLFLEDYKGDSCKLEQCLDLINTAIESEHKILLFSQFKSMLNIIKERLDEQNIPYYMIVGETSKEDRIKYVNQFNSDTTPIFLISLKAGGTGLNLTSADVVIHYDPWWNEAAMNQATDRAHRIGQTNVVTVYKMIVKDTIEEEIMKLQEAKSKLASDILEGSSTSMSSLSKEDLLEILK